MPQALTHFVEILKLVSIYGAPLVITVLAIYFAWRFGNMLLVHYTKKLEASRNAEVYPPRPSMPTLPDRGWEGHPPVTINLPSLPQNYEVREVEEEELEEEELEEEINTQNIHVTLYTHPFFERMEIWYRYDIPRLPIRSRFHKIVITDFLLIKYRTFRDGIHKMIQEPGILELEQGELAGKVVSTILGLVETYEREALAAGIPQAFVSKFNDWHGPSINFIIKNVEDLCRGSLMKRNDRRLEAVLNTLLFAFEITLADAEKTLGSLNGELDGLVYRGVRNLGHGKAAYSIVQPKVNTIPPPGKS